METKEIKLEKNKEIIAEGYKAIKYDLSTKGNSNFRYGKKGDDLIGKAFTVDEDIQECKWGLHFSKDPANVFKFYEPLGYNRYFKIQAFDEVVDTDDGIKSIARTIKFVEEYDIMQFIELIKQYDRSAGVNNSAGVNYSNGVNRSAGVNDSDGVNNSTGVNYSDGVNNSDGVNRSNGVNNSNGVNDSYGVRNCEAVSKCIFCADVDSLKYGLFNKRITEDRYNVIFKKISSFCYSPNFTNFYELKGNKKWYSIAFPELMIVRNKTAWSKIPKEMVDYLKTLPEYDEEIFERITGD